MEAIRLARRELPADVPLIGFAGAPFTLASYAIEGGASRTFTKTKRLMYQAPDTWHLLLSKLAEVVGKFPSGPGARRGAGAASCSTAGSAVSRLTTIAPTYNRTAARRWHWRVPRRCR